MNRTNTRRTTTILIAVPALAAALFAGGAQVSAQAAPGDPATCSSMAMPQTRASNGAPDMMTRAGQVTMNAPTADSGAAMGSGCTAAGHN